MLQSPFIGAVETSTEPVLYKRYDKSTDLLVVRYSSILNCMWGDLYYADTALLCLELIAQLKLYFG